MNIHLILDPSNISATEKFQRSEFGHSSIWLLRTQPWSVIVDFGCVFHVGARVEARRPRNSRKPAASRCFSGKDPEMGREAEAASDWTRLELDPGRAGCGNV